GLGVGFFTNSEKLFSKDELEQVLQEDSSFFIEYVETKWLHRYFKMKAMANETAIPSITSTISDTPNRNNQFSSKTESYALKSIIANEWINLFHEKLDLLPEEFKKLIELKYLNRREDGKYHGDYFVYTQLNVSRAKYYRMKKEALEELGRLLYPS
ncbi:hypothetical protein HUS65_21275, partial [Pseudoalteromonas sp. 2103]|nr:hypothetical protein [Pseudoalteromonas sp. 2103]